MSAPAKQLNIRLPEATHRKLKARCALDGLTLAEAVDELILDYLEGKVLLTSPPAKSGLTPRPESSPGL